MFLLFEPPLCNAVRRLQGVSCPQHRNYKVEGKNCKKDKNQRPEQGLTPSLMGHMTWPQLLSLKDLIRFREVGVPSGRVAMEIKLNRVQKKKSV